MDDKKKIIVCWNKSEYTKEIKRKISADYTPIICTDFDKLEKQEWSKISRIIVLCELQWNKERSNGAYSDMNGIRLVQEYIRSEMKIKSPVLFLSMLPMSKILAIKDDLDKDIIRTPALQHYFLDLLCLDELSNILEKMKPQTLVEYRYSSLFWNLDDQLARYTHHIPQFKKTNRIDDLRELFGKIKKNIEKRLLNDFTQSISEIETKLTDTGCKINDELLNAIIKLCDDVRNQPREDSNKDNSLDKTTPINILYLEDNQEDERVQRFIKSAELEKIIIEPVSTQRELEEILNNKSYPVIIVDVEIYEKENGVSMLNCLGFNVIKKLQDSDTKTKANCIYYLLTDAPMTTHRLFSQGKGVTLKTKEKWISSAKSIAAFIDEIKAAAKELENKDVFDRLYGFWREENEEDINLKSDHLIKIFIIQFLEFQKFIELIQTQKIDDLKTTLSQAVGYKGVLEKTFEGKYLKDYTSMNKEETRNVFIIKITSSYFDIIQNYFKNYFDGDFPLKAIKGSESYDRDNVEIKTRFIDKLILRRVAIFIWYYAELYIWDNCGQKVLCEVDVNKKGESKKKYSSNSPKRIVELHFGKDDSILDKGLYFDTQKKNFEDNLKDEEKQFLKDNYANITEIEKALEKIEKKKKIKG